MDLDLDTMFGTSVQEAVQATIRMNKPMFVFLTKGDNDFESVEFVSKHLLSEGEIHEKMGQILLDKFVMLKLVEDSVEFGYFKQIFLNLVLPSFYIVRKGELLSVISGEDSTEALATVIERIGGETQVQSGPGTESLQPSENIQAPTVPVHAQRSTNQTPTISTPTNPTPTNATPTNPTSLPIQPPVNTVNSPSVSHDQSVREHSKVVALERKQQAEERKRLRYLLQADVRERESRKREELERFPMKESNSESSTRQNVIREHAECILSIKLFDGSSLKHEFKPIQTLNDVRHWLDTETNEPIIPEASTPSFSTSSFPQPTHYVFHHPTIPRITFTDDQEFNLLQELGLCPRSALILKPIYDDKYSKSYPDGKVANGGLLKSMGSTLGRMGNALYSFFDYGVDDYRNQSEEISTQSEDYEGDHTLNTGELTDNRLMQEDNYIRSGTPLISAIDRATPIIAPMSRNRSTVSIPQELQSAEMPNYSRSSTPKLNPRLQSMSRMQTIHDDSKDSKDSKKDTETYNGNNVNLKQDDNLP